MAPAFPDRDSVFPVREQICIWIGPRPSRARTNAAASAPSYARLNNHFRHGI
jgi:hypothetical protein